MEFQVDIPNAFIGKKEKPTSQELADALGTSIGIWNQLIARLRDELRVVDQEWSSYSPKYGWYLKLKVKKRNIIYLSPCAKSIRVSLILGDRAMKAVRESRLSSKMLSIIAEAPRYPEGTGIVWAPAKVADIPSVLKLAAIKLAN